jgi:hypothetical protein
MLRYVLMLVAASLMETPVTKFMLDAKLMFAAMSVVDGPKVPIPSLTLVRLAANVWS